MIVNAQPSTRGPAVVNISHDNGYTIEELTIPEAERFCKKLQEVINRVRQMNRPRQAFGEH
jgi:hypothetical protein